MTIAIGLFLTMLAAFAILICYAACSVSGRCAREEEELELLKFLRTQELTQPQDNKMKE